MKSNLKKEYAELLHEKLIRDCRKNPSQFINYAISWGIPGWIPMGKMHVRWQETLSLPEAHHVAMICSRDHGKTTFVPIGRAIWELGNNLNLRIKIVCQSDDIAVKRLSAIIDNIERNPRIKEVFPELIPSEKGTWSKTKIYVNRQLISPDPSVEGVGILSTATGGRADLLIFDDPVDFRNSIQQPALRQMVIDAYNEVWMNIVEPDGRVFYIATPWVKSDLTHKIIDDPLYIKIMDKIDDNFTPIWPEKWDRKSLIAKSNEIGKRAFARAFKMEALSEEEALFSEEAIRKCENKNFQYGELPAELSKRFKQFFVGVDLGTGRTESGSYTAIFVGLLWNEKKVPVSITRGRFKSPEFAKIFYDVCEKYPPELAFVENNAAQEAIIQWVREVYGRDYYLPIKGYFTGAQKMDESVGLPSMAVEIEQGNWVLPKMDHSADCHCGYCIWLSELKEFPLGKYSDTVMASWLFREAIRHFTSKMPRIRSLNEPIKRAKTALLNPMEIIQQELERDDDD